MRVFNISTLLPSLLENRENSGLALTDVNGIGLTYADLRDQLFHTHKFLKDCGISSSDTVAISLRNGPETAALFLGIFSYCRVAPLNPAYTAAEVSFVLSDVRACALILAAGSDEHAAAARTAGVPLIYLEVNNRTPGHYSLSSDGFKNNGRAGESRVPEPDDIALLLHTSGTTARPKLTPLTHRNLYLSSRSVAEVLQLTPEDRCLSVMPLFHIHGLVAGLLASLMAGAVVCCAPGFQATSFFSWLDSSRATWFTAVPTMHQTILARARHNSGVLSKHALRLIRSSSAPLYPTVWEQLETVFGVPVLNAYGMTEAAHQITSVPLHGGARFRNTVGLSTGLDMAIMSNDAKFLPHGEQGEVVLRGAQITSGYLEPCGANASAFHGEWFRTGDQGVMDADGSLKLTGRLKELINSGGEKVSPYEVEEALLQHPSVSQAVAFAAPHEMLGEQVTAAVVLRDGFTATERELLQVAGQRLARAKIPRRVLFVPEIPRGATGKVKRMDLAASLGVGS